MFINLIFDATSLGGTRPSPYIRAVLLGEALHVNLTVLLLLFTASRWKDLFVAMPSLLFSPASVANVDRLPALIAHQGITT
jgi:hypothetical protein